MGELSATILASSQAAAEGGGGQSNFLVPNGTFFAVLIIFLITLAVIAKWVVPPVGKVLAEREAMLAKTAADNRKSAEQVAAAQADYNEAMAGARTQASAIRDEAAPRVARWSTPSVPRPAPRWPKLCARPMSSLLPRVPVCGRVWSLRWTDFRRPWPAEFWAST